GLNVSFVNVEHLTVDGLEGNDTFFVLSTAPGVLTTLIGNAGSDTFDIGGDVTLPIVAASAAGLSGFVNHSISSTDPAYADIFAPGVAVNVAGAQSGLVVISQTGGTSTVFENPASGPNVDTYTIALAVAAPATPT